MSEHETISHDEAEAIADRYNASHWKLTNKERARYSIPADPKRDDDLRLVAYIKQNRAKDSELASLKSELEDYRMLVRALVVGEIVDGTLNRANEWVLKFDMEPDIMFKIHDNGLPIFTPALRSALKAAVEGGKQG